MCRKHYNYIVLNKFNIRHSFTFFNFTCFFMFVHVINVNTIKLESAVLYTL